MARSGNILNMKYVIQFNMLDGTISKYKHTLSIQSKKQTLLQFIDKATTYGIKHKAKTFVVTIEDDYGLIYTSNTIVQCKQTQRDNTHVVINVQ